MENTLAFIAGLFAGAALIYSVVIPELLNAINENISRAVDKLLFELRAPYINSYPKESQQKDDK